MEEKLIKVVGAKEHNLKNISVEIPKKSLMPPEQENVTNRNNSSQIQSKL